MTDNDALVTIAIPAYKANYLGRAIKSALNQTYNRIEVIVVNDKSPEDIDSVLSRFNDPRLKYYKNTVNLGGKDPVANWNKCVEYAMGDYFCLLCDDDEYATTFVEELISLSKQYPDVKLFRSGVNIINKENIIIDRYPSSPIFETASEYIWHVAKKVRRQTISEWMIKTERIREVGGYKSQPLAWGSDFISIYKFAGTEGIVSTYKRLTNYRDSGENISTVHGKNTLIKVKALWLQHDETEKMLNSDKSLGADSLNIVDLHRATTRRIVIWQLSQGRMSDISSALRHSKEYRLAKTDVIKALVRKITSKT